MKKTFRFLVPLMLFLLIVGSIFWYLFIYDRAFTRDTLLSQARFQATHGNSRMSAWFYDAAYSFSGHDESVSIELANQYKATGNYTKAELTLTTAIHDEPTAELYCALSTLYVEQDKLMDAVALLENVSSPEIKAELDALRPTAPVSDYEAGYYTQYMDIHLSTDGQYIFYTTDGDYPSIAGLRYEDGISLPAGETTIYAIAVGSNGLVSPVCVLGYTVTGVIEEVTFTDEKMEAAIRELVNVSSGHPVYTNHLWQIQEFTVPEGVTNFDDLRLMPYLQKLTIQNQTMDSLSCLSTLLELKTLDMTGTTFPVSELSTLGSMAVLSELTLSDCGLSTIADLEGAKSLTYLDISNNTLRNLEVLSTMPELTQIYLQHNAVTDLTALGSLEKLQTLNVSYNALSTLSPLTGCIRLSHLEADNNQLSSLSGVEKLPMLTYLSVNSNNLTNISVLSGCTELTTLNIASNAIADITCLSTLTKLLSFDFSGNLQIASLPDWPEGCPLQTIDGSYNALTDLNVLKNMQSLTHVYMDYNQLTNIDSLSDCFCLVQVNVYGNAIPDVSALRDHDIIVNYDPTVQ